MGVTIKVEEDNFSKLISDLKELKGKSAYVGVVAEPDSELAIYAGANEFGAVIRSKKAIAKLYYLMVEEGLIDEKKFPIYLWMKSKKEIVIPERSFLRSTFHDEKEINKAIKLFQFAFNRFLSGNGSAINALEAAADSLVASVKGKITGDIPPDDHPLTQARKGHARTLMGKEPHLYKSISKQIVSE